MKKITSIIALLALSIGFSQTNPINFESTGAGANWTWNTFENPSTPCPPLNIIANPDMTGANTSATVASYTPVVGAPFYAGTETAVGSPFGTFTLNSTNSTVKILVWKPVISNVGIKFSANGASSGEINVANTLINQWEELTFNFASKIGQPSSTGINQIVIFIDANGGRTTNNTCYFDNITFGPEIVPPPGIVLPVDFENQTPGFYAFTSFGGCDNVLVSNPDASGINTSAKVSKNTRTVGAQTYAGSYFDLTTPIDFSTNQSLKMKVWTPNANTPVKLKLEGGGNPDIEVDVVAPLAATWQELTFNFPSSVAASTYRRVVVFFNFGAVGTGEVNYFDDVVNGNFLAVNQFANQDSLNMYPNPVNNILNIDSKLNIENVSIYNVLGQVVLQKSMNNSSTSLNVSSLQKGIYVLKAEIEGKVTTSRFIKN